MSSGSEKKNNFFKELGKRGVYQAVGLYIAITWGSIEILLTTAERFDWPQWLGDAGLMLFLTALPFVVLLSWAFDLTGSGFRRMEPGSLAGKFVIAATCTLIIGISGSWFFWQDNERQRSIDTVANDGRSIIAVLPFEDISGQGFGDWMPLAFTDEVINRINAHPDLVALDLQSVSHSLIEQRLQNESASIYRVTGKLLPAPVGTMVRVRMTDAIGNIGWEHEQIFSLKSAQAISAAQKWIAGQVAAGLGLSLAGIDYCEPSSNARATELYLGAREKFSQRGPANIAAAAQMLEEATRLDPNFARGLELLSEVYQRFPVWVMQDPSHYGMNTEELERFLREQPEVEAAKRALSLCPTLGAAYFTVEISAPVNHTFADAVDLMEESLRRDPSNVILMGRMVEFLLRVGHVNWADSVAREMYLRDPLSTRVPHVLAWTQNMLGNLDRAIELEHESLNLGYELHNILSQLSSTYVSLGDNAGLERLLDENFEPSERMPVDPRDVMTARSDEILKESLIETFRELVNSGEPIVLRSLSGWPGRSLALDLGDEELAWLIMEKWAEVSGPAGMPMALWNAQYRHWFGNSRLLELDGYRNLWADFWDRKGPPDGCEWDGQDLTCEWADNR